MEHSEKPATKVPADVMAPRLIFLLAVLALLLIGLVMVYSASFVEAIHEGESSTSYVTRQAIYAACGVIFGLIAWKVIPVHLWQGNLTYLVWLIACGLLVLTAVIGNVGLGAQRWVDIGPFSLQPSEFAKIAFILVACKLLYDYRTDRTAPKIGIALLILLLVLPIAFLYRSQSDFGTTLIIAVGILAVLWLGEVPMRIIVLVCLAGIVFVLAAVFMVGYRADRFVFLNPWNDGEGGYGVGYQTIHSWYAFSEGGIFGVGLGNSHEKYLYLPEAETDFIFAVVGEELGMVGALLVIVLFLALLYAGLRIAKTAANGLSGMLAGSLTIMICFQAFLNIGCVIGLLPVTGKPLPFISSGGSSLIATLIMAGLILAVSKEAATADVYERRREDLVVVHEEASPKRVPALSLGDFTVRRTSAAERSEARRTAAGSARRDAYADDEDVFDDSEWADERYDGGRTPRRSETLGWGETFGLKSNRERALERMGAEASDEYARSSVGQRDRR